MSLISDMFSYFNYFTKNDEDKSEPKSESEQKLETKLEITNPESNQEVINEKKPIKKSSSDLMVKKRTKPDSRIYEAFQRISDTPKLW